jgi:UDP-N-acetylglucosamine 2-epimerase
LNFGHHDTTLTASVAAFHNQIPIAHIEDLNDFNSEKFFSAHLQRSHRSVAVLAELLFTPSAFAKNALIHEGINENMIYSVGSTLSDITHLIMQGYSRSDCLRTLFSSLSNLRMQQIIRGDFLILDLLYPSNIHKTVELLPRIIELNKDFLPIFISRDINMVDSFRQQSCLEGILSLEHVNHLQRCSLLAQASCVVTDNEDTLEECTAYGTKGILLKEHTGRFDLISSGLATIAAPQPELLCGQIISARRGNHQKSLHLPSLHASSTATASKQIVQALLTSRTSGISQKSKTEPLSRRAG